MKIVKGINFLHMKGTYAVWLWPAVYVSYHSYDAIKSLTIQFNWLNFTGVISFQSDASYYNDPILWSKEETKEYIEKGGEQYFKDKNIKL